MSQAPFVTGSTVPVQCSSCKTYRKARAREAATSKDPEKMYSVHCWILSEREQMAATTA